MEKIQIIMHFDNVLRSTSHIEDVANSLNKPIQTDTKGNKFIMLTQNDLNTLQILDYNQFLPEFAYKVYYKPKVKDTTKVPLISGWIKIKAKNSKEARTKARLETKHIFGGIKITKVVNLK